MNINDLNRKLENAINSFAAMTKINYEEISNIPATHDDICELSDQLTYALTDMKNAIIDYLQSNQ